MGELELQMEDLEVGTFTDHRKQLKETEKPVQSINA